MPIISLIVAMDEANGIGKNNQLLCHLPTDLKYFKSMTLNKPILMGRKTFESIGKPLPQRQNVVLSHTMEAGPEVMVFSSLAEALAALNASPEIMVIGGAQLYEQTLPIADRLYVTHIHHTFQADTFFPKIDPTLWSCNRKEHYSKDEKNPYDMSFCLYERTVFASYAAQSRDLST